VEEFWVAGLDPLCGLLESPGRDRQGDHDQGKPPRPPVQELRMLISIFKMKRGQVVVGPEVSLD
jgi:hypothetical protein